LAKVVEACRRKLKAPQLTREEYVAVLMKNGCHVVAQAMATKWRVECPVAAKDGTLYYESDKPAVKKGAKAPRSPKRWTT
jgi:hypothetical protein